jgi:hypothetical protein
MVSRNLKLFFVLTLGTLALSVKTRAARSRNRFPRLERQRHRPALPHPPV